MNFQRAFSKMSNGSWIREPRFELLRIEKSREPTETPRRGTPRPASRCSAPRRRTPPAPAATASRRGGRTIIFYFTALFHAMLYYIILYYTILYYTIVYHTIVLLYNTTYMYIYIYIYIHTYIHMYMYSIRSTAGAPTPARPPCCRGRPWRRCRPSLV